MTPKAYTFTDVQTFFVGQVSRRIARRYRAYGVDADELRSVLLYWMYEDTDQETGASITPGEKKIRRWLDNSPQQTTRIWRTLEAVAVGYGEKEKALRCGYETSDVQWYSPSMIEALLPLALDDTYDAQTKTGEGEGRSNKPAHEGGDLLAMVLDVRRAYRAAPDGVQSTLRLSEAGVIGWDDAVQYIINWLGGTRPWVGRRKVLSNAQSQAITKESE